jgi:hypothetical protein
MSNDLSLSKRIGIILGLSLLLGVAVGFALEIRHLVNTRHFVQLVGIALVLGAIGGFFLGRRWVNPDSALDEKVKIYVICMTLGAAVLPFVAGWTNRIFSPRKAVSYQFVEQEGVYAFAFGLREKDLSRKADSYIIWLARQGEMIRYSSRDPFPEEVSPGDEVAVWTREGFWGFPVLEGYAGRE